MYRKLSPHAGIEKSLHNNLLGPIHCKMCYDFGIGGEMRWNDSHHISTGWIPATNSRRYILRLLPVLCMYGSWWCGELLTGRICTFRVRTCTNNNFETNYTIFLSNLCLHYIKSIYNKEIKPPYLKCFNV